MVNYKLFFANVDLSSTSIIHVVQYISRRVTFGDVQLL